MPDIFFFCYLGIYALGGSVLTAIITHIWVSRKLLHVNFSLPLLCTIWIWYMTHLLEFIMLDSGLKLFFNYGQHLSMIFLPLTWLVFCYKYTYRHRLIPRLAVIFIPIPVLFLLILIFTNSSLHWLWQLHYSWANEIYWRSDLGPGFIFYLLFSSFCIILGFYLLGNQWRTAGQYKRRQTLVFFFTGMFPFLTIIIDFVLMERITYARIAPLLFVLGALVVLYYGRLRYFRTIPLSQHTVIESMNDICIVLNPENQIIYCNPATYINFPLSPVGVIGKPVDRIFQVLRSLLLEGNPAQFKNSEADLAGKTYDISVSPIFNRRRTMTNRVLVLRDITRLKQSEESLRQITDHLESLVLERTEELDQMNRALVQEIVERKKTAAQLQSSLEEKNILLGEIHHRVKNNLQVIISMLKLQKKYLSDDKSQEVFNSVISRIKAIAIIHEKLYKSEDLANTNVLEYLKDLVVYLFESHRPEDNSIRLQMDVEKIFLDLDRSILCGLIINELIINAIKYAFPPHWQPGSRDKERTICVYFQKQAQVFCFGVEDNGIGLPADLDLDKVDSLGMKIVRTLVRQLSGSLEVNRAQGTGIKITFS